MANKEGYTCTINLIEDDPICSCNLPQFQKLPCPHVTATCAKERDCTNISTCSLCASWYTVETTLRLMLDYFIMFLVHGIGQSTMGMLSYHLKLEGQQVTHLLFAYTVLWMKGVTVIDAIGVAIENN